MIAIFRLCNWGKLRIVDYQANKPRKRMKDRRQIKYD